MTLLSAAAACTSNKAPLSVEPEDWCQRIVAGAPGIDAEAIGLAQAHFVYRYFGVTTRDEADTPLVHAFAGAEIDLNAYAATAADTCALAAEMRTLPAASVTLRGAVAWVKPGTGEVVIPDPAAAIALDLRGLPNTPELEAALDRATAAVLAEPLERAEAELLAYSGHPDSWNLRYGEVPAEYDAYATEAWTPSRQAWSGDGPARPLAVVTDVAMPPIAAQLALELRASGRAMLVGYSVLGIVAEATWRPVGARGLAIRQQRLALPDFIGADVRTDDPENALASASDIIATEPIAEAPTRAAPAVREFYDWPVEEDGPLDAKTLKAALAVAYAGARGFWPVYDAWDPEADAAYLAGIDEAAGAVTTRAAATSVLSRFTGTLADAHIYVADLAPDRTSTGFVASVPLDFDVIGGEPVVKTSLVATIHPGDTVVAVDGAPVASFLEPYLEQTAAATALNHAVTVANYLWLLTTPQRTFTLRAPDGVQREVTVGHQAGQTPFGPQRESGFLTDLSAPSIYYMNVNGYGPAYTEDQLLAQLTVAQSGSALIIDGRGYPAESGFELISRIVGDTVSSPRFDVPRWIGADELSLQPSSYTLPAPTGAPYTKPVVLLVGPQTQSAAENFAMMLQQRASLVTLGRQTSASNGNVTSLVLPGGFGMVMTGMRVTYSDGHVFHGSGVKLTIESYPSAVDLAGGIDRELVDAIAYLQ